MLIALWWLSGALAMHAITRRSPRRPEPLPTRAGLQVAEHRLATRSGETFGAWWFPGEPGSAVLLLLHAIGGSRSRLVDRARRFQERGFSVLAPTLLAHGDASGQRNDYGLGASTQVPACLDLIDELAPRMPVVVDGMSLGAATAILAAGDATERVDGYVLEAPFRDLASAAKLRLRERLPRPLAGAAYLALRAAAPLYLDVNSVSPLRAIEVMPREVPALFLVGSRDLHTPPVQVAELVRAHGGNAKLVVVPGAGHNDMARVDPARYWGAIDSFLEAVVKARSAASTDPGARRATGR